jgi:hypothetical protein
MVGRSSKRLQTTIDQIRADASTVQITPLIVDLSTTESAAQLTAMLDEHALNPKGFVHCARSLDYSRQDERGAITRDNWLGEFNLDVVVPHEIALCLSNRPASKLESIIIISSMYGVTPPKPALYLDPSEMPPIHYGVCKAAQLHLARELSGRLAPKGIRVNCISYGGLRGRVDSAFEQRYAAQCPAGKMLEESDLAGPVLFLLSAQSAATTGHNLLADGGWTVW